MLRAQLEELRQRVDQYNATHPEVPRSKQVVFDMGQYVRPIEGNEGE